MTTRFSRAFVKKLRRAKPSRAPHWCRLMRAALEGGGIRAEVEAHSAFTRWKVKAFPAGDSRS